MKWKIGDKVRLTGGSWPSYESKVQRGTYHTVSEVDRMGHFVEFEGNPGVKWLICNGWEIELVEREEETMSVDFSEVNVGDRVRLTRENGDESTFTVKFASGDFISSDSQNFSTKLWDTLEIVERAFKPVPGLYSNGRESVMVTEKLEVYLHALTWIPANPDSKGTVTYDAVREIGGWRREITF